MTWISKNLTLDLLAIGIHAMQKTFDRIKQEPDNVSPWPQVESTQAAPGAVEEAPAPKEEPAAEPTPEPKPEPQEEETPDLLPEAQNTLRAISMDEGPGWITGTLFPHFNVQSLTDVPADKLPELITMAQKHHKGD
ncbi:hypothetical protein QP324_04175 [Corynebacterium sp. UMB0012]|uniref:hypothetical protein n=1 Tax=Corynebacterium sp. UMB0012 TaxID=3046344 RepID=UPI00254DC79D|nr:hypothetical protein [Corynebacterium sp. UMB0012]MDK7047772.1 hypothetical protein [Corynebacterium sp. UMB0012]